MKRLERVGPAQALGPALQTQHLWRPVLWWSCSGAVRCSGDTSFKVASAAAGQAWPWAVNGSALGAGGLEPQGWSSCPHPEVWLWGRGLLPQGL